MEENMEETMLEKDTKEENQFIKRIILTNPIKEKKEKEKKMRVETKTWGLKEPELSHQTQLEYILSDDFLTNKKDKYISSLSTHIKNKISNYKQQDVLKKKLNKQEFVSYDETVKLLKESLLKCCYCSEEVYILYEHVRATRQWSLDRINNDIGHNKDNLLISCLECNLKRRRTNKDAFMFTKNMKIIKEKTT